MSGRPIKKGSTDQSTVIRIIDATDGTPEQAVEHNTAGIALWWRREGETLTAITEAALASLDAAHSDGGIEHIDDGYYRLDLPDTAVAAGAGENGVMVGGAVTGMIVIGTYHPLVDYDPYDAVRMGMTALPNAVVDAAGGLPISDAGGLDLDTKLANTNEITAARMGALTDWINGGRLDLILDIIAADTTTDIPGLIATAQSDLDTITGTDGVTLATAQALYAPNKVVPDAAGVAPTAAEIQAEMEENGASILDTLRDDLADGGRLDLILDTIAADTTTDIPALIATAQADLDELTDAGTLSAVRSALMLDRIYTRLFHEVNVTDADGAAAIRNSGDSADIATGSITDNATTTSQAKWAWV